MIPILLVLAIVICSPLETINPYLWLPGTLVGAALLLVSWHKWVHPIL